MKKPDKPGQQSHDKCSLQTKRDDLLRAFAKETIHGNVILLLGHESLLRIPSEEEGMQDKDLADLRECNGSIEGWMNHIKTSNVDNLSLKKFYANWFDDDNKLPKLDKDDINPEILKLLESKQIRVVLTTTYDPLIEETMKVIWGGNDSIDVKNFLDNEDILPIDKYVLKNDIKPTLFYLFGKATNDRSDPRNYGNPDFVIDEEDYIKTIKKWMIKPPRNLMSFISMKGTGKRILAIGCKFDYWLFRFFWRAVLETEESPNYKHLLAISLTTSPSDVKLREIFKLYKLQFPDDVNEFLMGLNQTIEKLRPTILEEERKERGIFISYHSADKEKVLTLFYRLIDEEFNVWMDTSLKPGDDYKNIIKTAIDNCTVFVPVLSSNISQHKSASNPCNQLDENYHFYRDVEWELAQTRYENEKFQNSDRKMKIIPFALDGYKPKDVPKEIMEKYPQIVDTTHVELSYNHASFAKFIASIKHAME